MAPTRGGKRSGAGRHPDGVQAMDASVLVRMTRNDKEMLRELGGAQWIRNGIREAQLMLRDNVFRPVFGAPCRLPLAESTVRAGFPSPAEDFASREIDLNELLIANAPATVLVEVRGDSMIDAGIAEGDLLVVDRSLPAVNNAVVVMQVDEAFTVKRYIRNRDGSFFLHAENDSGTYPDIHPGPGSQWTLFGVVRHVIKTLRKQ